MNTDSVLRDEETAQPLVQWYPRGGPMRAVSPEVIAIGGVALGVLATAALAFAFLALTRRGGLLERDD